MTYCHTQKPLSPKYSNIIYKRDAQEKINKLAIDSSNVAISTHAIERMSQRDFMRTDILDILKNGIIAEEPEKRKNGDLHYKVECRKFRGGRDAAVIIAIREDKLIVITVMWLD